MKKGITMWQKVYKIYLIVLVREANNINVFICKGYLLLIFEKLK